MGNPSKDSGGLAQAAECSAAFPPPETLDQAVASSLAAAKNLLGAESSDSPAVSSPATADPLQFGGSGTDATKNLLGVESSDSPAVSSPATADPLQFGGSGTDATGAEVGNVGDVLDILGGDKGSSKFEDAHRSVQPELQRQQASLNLRGFVEGEGAKSESAETSRQISGSSPQSVWVHGEALGSKPRSRSLSSAEPEGYWTAAMTRDSMYTGKRRNKFALQDLSKGYVT